jgi:hypothetical protein
MYCVSIIVTEIEISQRWKNMATPTRQQIIDRAKELYVQQCYRDGTPELADVNPEIEELRESGLLSVAQSELMFSESSTWELERWERYDKATNEIVKLYEKSEQKKIPIDLTEFKNTGWFSCGTSQSGKTTLNKHIVNCLLKQGIIVDVLDVSRAWAHDTPINNVITIPHNGTDIDFTLGESVVLDMSQLSFAERKRFVNAFVEVTYRAHMAQGYKRAPFRFIIFEEAQTYFFNGCFRSPKSYSAPIDLVTVGANYNIRFGLITQFPAMVDKAPVKISQQRYFGWTTEKNDIDYVRKFIGKEYVDPENPDSVYNLQTGEFLYQLRNKITKFSIKPYGTTKSVSNGYSYEMSFPLVS